MKAKNILTVIIILCSYNSNVFSQCSSWIGTGASSLYEGAWSIITDDNNNVYSTGDFQGSITFGSSTITNSSGGYSYYVNKYNTNGVYQWAVHMDLGGSFVNFPPVICQNNGFLYVAGMYFDTLIYNSSKLTVPGYNCFLLKLDLNSNLIWMHSYSGGVNNDPEVLGIAINKSNQVCLTGRFIDTISFDSHKVTTTGIGDREAFLVKTDSNGYAIWAEASTSSASTPFCRGWGITTDNNENILITGVVYENITYGTTTFNTSNTGGENPYLAKFDSSGNCLWIQGGAGPLGFSPSYSAVTDAKGNIYFGGSFDSTITFASNTLYTLNGDLFYCKYGPSGNLIWAKQIGTNLKSDALTSLKMNASGNIWMSGWLAGSVNFGSYPVTPNAGDVFMAEFDSTGVFKDALGSKGTLETYSSAIDNNGNLYIGGGTYYDTVGFQGDTIINKRDTDGDFVLKYCTFGASIKNISKNENQLNVYPNPSNGIFTIAFSHPELVSGSQTIVEIYNEMGQKVNFGMLKQVQHDYELNLTNQPSGVYFYRAISETGDLLGEGKLIIQK